MTEAAILIESPPVVSKASSADVMNVLLRFQLDFAKSQSRTDTLLEQVQRQGTEQRVSIDKLTSAVNEMQAHNGITREIVTGLQSKSTDHETRLRAVEKDMEDLRDTREALKSAQEDIKGLKAEISKLKEDRAKLIGMGMAAGALAGLLIDVAMRYLIQ